MDMVEAPCLGGEVCSWSPLICICDPACIARKNITVTSNLYVWKYPSCKQVEEFTFKLDYRTSISCSFRLIRGSYPLGSQKRNLDDGGFFKQKNIALEASVTIRLRSNSRRKR
ncbi:hypothetical protein NL676_032582 [Syzygium grande]|nr:hypothetical protein NL676_032582 [Syzygium grande]